MLKLLTIASLLMFSNNANFVKINSIECFSNVGEKIEFSFEVDSDYNRAHQVDVKISLYDNNDNLIGEYQNNLKIVGDKKAIAKIDYIYNDNIYALIDVIYNQNTLVSSVKFEFYKVDKCYLNKDNRECKRIYKSVYKNGIVVKKESDFKLINAPFDDFLENNNFDLNNLLIYSDYDFLNDDVYLIIKNEIKEFNLPYDGGYQLPLQVSKNDFKYSFSLLEEYYFNLNNYSFDEVKSINNIPVNELYFPFLNDYKEYELMLVIEGILDIEIEIKVSTSDKLFGECEESKYCLEEINYD